MSQYLVEAELYRLADWQRDQGMRVTHPPTAWEYRMSLVSQPSGRVIDQWDSADGREFDLGLSYRRCQAAVAEIKADVKAGDVRRWFTLPKATGPVKAVC